MDFNKNNSWGDPGEQIFTNTILSPGQNDLNMFVPPNAQLGSTFARFRFSTMGNLSYTGLAPNGEVEDHQVELQQEEEMDYGDAPDSYRTLAASNGARHDNIGPVNFMGNLRDLEMNGIPTPNALGDDRNPIGGMDDEDGVTFMTPLIPGGMATVSITVNMLGPLLQGWIDFNADGDFLDDGEQILTNINPPAIVSPYNFIVPINATVGPTFARFRFSTMPDIPSFGPAPNGEVEDYMTIIGEWDFGDAPDPGYPTKLASNGAGHKLSGLFLGVHIDAEPDGQPDATATGDDLNPPGQDDEDGVWWACDFVTGFKHTLKVTTTGQGFFNGWFDFNNDGDWDDTGEQVFSDVLLPAGMTEVYMTVPTSAFLGNTFARFRFSSLQGLGVTGLANDGEVEDYSVVIREPGDFDMGDLPDPPYPTVGFNDGARHYNDPFNPIFLGLLIDWEADGQPTPNAKGDDNNNLRDEDGVVFNTRLTPGVPAFITVTASIGGGAFQGWIDFDQNGTFDAGEQIFTNEMLVAGPQPLNFVVPPGALLGHTFARFRYSTMGNLSAYGCAPNGEVEDYQVAIVPQGCCDVAMWHLDENGGSIAYDATVFNNDGTINGAMWVPGYMGSALYFNNEFSHVSVPASASLDITGPFSIQAWIKPVFGSYWYHGIFDKMEHMPDGSSHGYTLYINDNGRLRLSCYSGASGDGDVFGATDLMDDAWHYVMGSWDGYYLRVYVDGVMEGEVPWSFPPASSSQDLGIGMRLSGWGDYMPFHGIIDEVVVSGCTQYDVDWGDAPDPSYPTLAASNGARHMIGPLFLGALIDAEVNGQPNLNALGDDLVNLDDEDGVILPAIIKPGVAGYSITVTASQTGYLQGWFDWNRDGDWGGPGEQVYSNVLLTPVPTVLLLPIPAGVTAGRTYARFRVSTVQNLPFTGYATDGEVEDYIVNICSPDEKMHWVQRPDLEPTGMDVDLTWVPTADDWMCTETGPVNKIRIWVSFADDIMPNPLNKDTVRLQIFSDIPASPTHPWSMPGSLLWSKTYYAGEYSAKLVSTTSPEWWYDPATQIWEPNNHNNVVRFDFDLGPIPFTQVMESIYWLEVKYMYQEPPVLDNTLGWKTAEYPLRFNDDAVWWNENNPNFPIGWVAHVYPGAPIPHPWEGQSFDMAFQLNPPPDIEEWDFGDLPDPKYPTLLASNGPRHLLGNLFLGNLIDAEPDGLPHPSALGDDNNNLADEDGVLLPGFMHPGGTYSIIVTASSSGGYLQGWIDQNADGDFDESGEQIILDQSLVAGDNSVTFTLNPSASLCATFARFRLSTLTGLGYTGAAPDGEVEDYKVYIVNPDDSKMHYPQPPDLEPTGMDVDLFWTPTADDFLCTESGPITHIRTWMSFADDIIPQPLNLDTLMLIIHADVPAGIEKPWSMPGQVLYSEVFHAGEYSAIEVATDKPEWWYDPATQWWQPDNHQHVFRFDFRLDGFIQTAGTVYWLEIRWLKTYPFPPSPPDPRANTLGWKTTRLDTRFNDDAVWWNETNPGFPFGWVAHEYPGLPSPHPYEGLSFDMSFVINPPSDPIENDFGDAPDRPYPTLAINGGAYHVVDGITFLGLTVDMEADGLPDPNALGDDLDATDDEDGVKLQGSLTSGNTTSIDVYANTDCLLNAWFDFNHNGTWADAGEHVYNNVALGAGSNILALAVPAGTSPGALYSRFRVNQEGGISFNNFGGFGEVEDYKFIVFDTIPDVKQGNLQYPDPNGWDVNMTYPATLADDWICNQTGAVTDFHFWVSWLDDHIPGDLESVLQSLDIAIYSDIPASQSPSGYSMPGNQLWSRNFTTQQFTYQRVFEHLQGWLDPYEQTYEHNNHYGCFRIDVAGFENPFIQFEGNIYWLVITAHLSGGGGGSQDVIVTLDNVDPAIQPFQPWNESGVTLWLEPWGGGCSYGIGPTGITLSPALLNLDLSALPGRVIHAEVDIIDWCGPGCTVATLYDGIDIVSQASNPVSGPQTLLLDNSGAWDPDRLTVTSYEGYVEEIRLVMETEEGFMIGWKSSADHWNDRAVYYDPSNPFQWGEMYDPVTEGPIDLAFAITGVPYFDLGDAPDPYPTVLAVNGAHHVADNVTYLGSLIDKEIDGLPTPNADGDDLSNLDDEDGVDFLWPLAKGNPCKISVVASVGDALFNCWIDYNRNGSWADPGEHVFSDLNILAGANPLTFIVPQDAKPGQTYARFRFSHHPALSYDGIAFDGEVEDYAVEIVEYGDMKWQQLPDTLLPGLHVNDPPAIADDWICNGGVVTDLHWWGNYELGTGGVEKRGAGINHFLVKIYSNASCLPFNLLRTYIIPFAPAMEVWTGMNNAEGSKIYLYNYLLPEPFIQTKDTIYWIAIQEVPNNVQNPPQWRWQEANRWFFPISCGAAINSGGPWQTITWPSGEGTKYDDMAFRITSWRLDTLYLQNIDVTGTEDNCYDANLVIIVAGGGTSFTVQPGGRATMIAGSMIKYLPYTHVLNGGYMHGYITTTGEFCNSLKSSPLPEVIAQPEDQVQPEVITFGSGFRVYPNPTTGSFTLEVTGTNTAQIMIYGIYGKPVAETTLSGQTKYDLSLALQPPGVYILRVICGNETWTVKVIKQ